jgi:hypothetical protein
MSHQLPTRMRTKAPMHKSFHHACLTCFSRMRYTPDVLSSVLDAGADAGISASFTLSFGVCTSPANPVRR